MAKETTYHFHHQVQVVIFHHLRPNFFTYIFNFTIAQNISQVLLYKYSIFRCVNV